MSAVKQFIRKAEVKPDFTGVFFNGTNAAEVVALVMERKNPAIATFYWDGPYCFEMVILGITLRRNTWFFWDHESNCYKTVSPEYALENLKEIEE